MPRTWKTIAAHAAAAALLLAALCGAARAQGTGRSMEIDGSPISSGMGGASAAAFWTAEPNYWANPALLGYYHGLRWQYGRTRLVPGLAANVWLTSHRFTLAEFGLGFEAAGRPVRALGGTRLDYGVSESYDQFGNPMLSFDSYEDIKTWGVGLSLGELVRSTAQLAGVELPPIARYFDVAGGFAQKRITMAFAPQFLHGTASGTSLDKGLLVRAGIGTDVLGLKDVPEIRLDLSYANAVLGYNDESVLFLNEDQAAPLSRTTWRAKGARLAVGMPREFASGIHDRTMRTLVHGLDPLVSLGYAYDNEHVQAGSEPGGYWVYHRGYEVTLANVLSLRLGHALDPLGEIDGGTWGFGIGIPLGDIAGARYDYARYPQARDSGLPDVTRHSASLWMDPRALMRWLRPAKAAHAAG